MRQQRMVVAVGAFLIFWRAGAFAAADEKILARVGEEKITLQEFQEMLPALSAFRAQGDAEARKRKLLEGLINQRLFAREAVRMGLDQAPPVKVKLNQARTNILAQEYMKSRAQGVSIGDKEVMAFFEGHQGEFQGKGLKEVEGQIKAKLLQNSMGDLIQKTKTELWKREKVIIDEQLLKEVEVPQRSTVNP
ncbi:MAG: SurA N-terminal domain-containing protein [candidate division NC10 bacterium]|nr:SurA N-terminal domain-containing protein [candidate division NC10 bacterium]